eukprot:TRINITY_DN4600_c1_g2_i1.p1 TRINITY_DN4600_c1_g2~~TRINITY_DN4600_c1_g2_i1.p1  ORF type:complete len:1835 (+),score=918.66 TRINITY_DN4600_c1_g2_i1:1143-6647(+)
MDESGRKEVTHLAEKIAKAADDLRKVAESLFDSEDPLERVLELSKAIEEDRKKLDDAIASGNDEEIKIQSGRLAAHAKQQSEALEKLADKTDDNKSKDRFRDASNKLKEEAEKLEKLNDDYANKALDDNGKKNIKNASRRIGEANDSATKEAERLNNPNKTAGSVLELAEKIEKDVKDTDAAKKSGDQKAVKSEISKLADDVEAQAAAGRALASEIPDKKSKQKVQEAASKLDNEKEKLDQLQKEYSGKPLDEEGKAKLDKILKAVKKHNDVLKKAAQRLDDHENPLDSVLELAKKIDDDRSNLGGALSARDETTTKNEAARLKDHVDQQSKAAALLGEVGTDDQNLKKKLKEASDGLKEEKKKLEDFNKKREGKPRMDEASKKELEDIDKQVKKHNDEIRRIAEKLANPNDLIDSVLVLHAKIVEDSGKVNDSVSAGDDKNSKAEIAKLSEHAAQQSTAGKALAEELEDPKTKEKVLEACKTLEQNKEKLDALAKEYASKPLDESGKAKLEGLVESTKAASEIVKRAAERHANPDNSFDVALALTKKVDDDLKNSTKASDANDDKATKSELAKLAEDSGALAKAAQGLASETNDERLKQKALDAASQLEDGKNKLEKVLKEYEGKPLDASAKEKIKAIKKQLEDANEAIKAVAEKLSHPNEASDNVLALHKKISDELETAKGAQNKGDEKKTKEEIEKLKSDVPKQSEAGRVLAKEIHDPKASKKVEDLCKSLDSNNEKLKELSTKPLNDESNKSKLEDVLAAVKRANDALKRAAERQANPDNKYDSALALAEKIEEDQRNLNGAVANKNDPSSKFEAKKLAGHVGQQAKVARSLAAEAGDDKTKQKALDAGTSLDKSKKRLEALEKQYADKPYDAVAKAELEDVNAQIKEANDAVKQLAQKLGSDNNADEVLANSKKIKEHSAKAKNAIGKNDDKTSKQELNSLLDALKNQLEAGKALADDEEDDETKEKIKEALENLERAKDKLSALQKEYANKPFDDAAKKKLQRLLEAVEENNRNLHKAAAKSSDSDAPQEAEVELDADEKVARLTESLEETLEDLEKKDNSAKELASLAKDLAKQTKGLVAATKESAKKKDGKKSNDDDDGKIRKVFDAADKLDASCPPLVSSINDKVKSGPSASSDQKVSDGVDKTKKALKDLKTALAEKELSGLGDDLKENLDKLNSSVAGGKTAEAKVAHDASQKAIEKTIHFGKDLAKSVENPALVKQIEKAVKVLEEKKEKLKEAQKEALSLPTEQKIKEVKQLSDEILDAASRVSASKHLPEDSKRPEDEITSNSNDLKQILKDLQDAANSGSKDDTQKGSKKLDQNTERQVGIAKTIADGVSDQKKWGEIIGAVQAVQDSTPRVNEAAEAVANNPNDQRAKENLRNEVANRLDAERKLNAAILDDQFGKNLVELEKQKSKIADSLKGSAQVGTEQAKNFKDALNRQANLGRNLADQSKASEVEKQKKLRQLADALEGKVPDFGAASTEKGRATRAEKLESVLGEIDDALDRFHGKKESGSEDPTDQCNELLYKTNYMAPKFDRLARSTADPKTSQDAIDFEVEDTDKESQDEVALANKLADRVNDKNLQFQLIDGADKLDKARKRLNEARKRNPGESVSAEKNSEAQQALSDAKLANLLLKKAAEQVKQRGAFAAKPEAKTNVIDQAADQVAEAGNVRAVNIYHDAFLKIIRAIAAEMKNLSKNSKKTEMIVAAKNIAGHIENVQKLSNQLAEPCTNPKLKDALLNLSRVPKNFSVQLKIIAAVKSDSGDGDKTAFTQLATCATGLSQSVVKCAHAAEAAALASPKDSIAWQQENLPEEFYNQRKVGSLGL